MFAVVAHFDQKTEQTINTLWKGLSASSISNYAYEVSDRKPHIIEALEYCSKHLLNLHSEIVEIAVIKINYDKNKAVGVSKISNERLS